MDEEIIELYEKYETCKAVADELGISREKVRATLIKHGIPRTHRHPKPEPKCKGHYTVEVDVAEAARLYEAGNSLMEIGETLGCNWMTVQRRLKAAGIELRTRGKATRVRASLDEILDLVDDGLSYKEIAAQLGCTVNGIKNKLYRAGIKPGKRNIELPMDEVMAMFDDGEPLASIARAFGCDTRTIKKRLESIGYVFESGGKKLTQEDREQRFAKRLSEKPGGDAYEYISGYVTRYSKVVIRCKTCGTLSEHITYCLVDVRTARIHECPVCAEARRAAEAEQRRAEREEELAKDKHCAVCGAVFHSEQKGARYCSKKCREKRYDSSHRKRARLFSVGYDGSISWRSLSERLGHCNCEICGEPCDPNDNSWGGNFGPLYPSVDCIVPMSKGGGYTWDNVQLAHCICNSIKRDLESEEEIIKAVTSYA